MNRLTPTEPPEEPVNRIAPFLEKLEAHEVLGLHGSIEDMSAEVRELFHKAWSAFLTSPENMEACKELIRSRYEAGDYRACVGFAEVFQHHAAAPDPEVEAWLMWAKSKLAEGGA